MKNLSIARSGKNKNLLVLLILLLLFLSTLSSGFASFKEEILRYKVRNPRVSRIIHKIIIVNKGKFTVNNLKVWIPIIRNETPYHFAIINSITTNHQYDFKSDPSNNTYIFWHINSMLPGEMLTAKIEYSLLSFNVWSIINADLVGSYSKESPLYRSYTQPEQFIESNDPLIVETARSIAGNETNPHILALKIADFVSKHLKYKVQDNEQGAKWALEHGEGDCSEFSYLFTALCRACGIPARVKAGFAFHSNVEETEFGHMWAEYYLPNYGWIPVDLTWNQLCSQDSLHFSMLQTFPIKYPYDTVFIEYSAFPSANIEAFQTIKISLGSIADFENFHLAYLTYDAIHETENVESLYFLATLIGAGIFTPEDYTNLEKAIEEFDMTLQQSLETNDLNGIQQAYAQIEYISSLAEGIIFKCGIMLTLTVLIIILIVYAVSWRRHKIEAEFIS